MSGGNRLMALAAIDSHMLARLLQLPDGSDITAVGCPHDRPGIVELRIEGAGFPTAPGHVIPTCNAIVTSVHTIEAGWIPRIRWPFSTQEAAA